MDERTAYGVSAKAAVERTLSILTVAAAAILVWTVAGSVFGSRAIEVPATGSELALKDVDWARNGTTLLIALQAECPYCEASIPFYRDLVASNAASMFRPIVVFPHDADGGKRLLSESGLDVSDVRQADFRKLKIPGTPTLMVVNAEGRVVRTWVGRLPSAREDGVFEHLGLKRAQRTSDGSTAGRRNPDEMGAETFASLRTTPVVLDTRPREAFREGHIRNAMNIPLDELEARLPHEVSTQNELILFCDYAPECAVLFEGGQVGTSRCDFAVSFVEQLGFLKRRVLIDSLDSLEASGVRVIRREG